MFASFAGEYFVKEELLSVQDSGSNAMSEVTPENFRRASRSERRVAQHLEGKKIELLDSSSQGKWIFHDTILMYNDARDRQTTKLPVCKIKMD